MGTDFLIPAETRFLENIAITLGMDSEVVLYNEKQDLYPHQLGMPQERGSTAQDHWLFPHGDWHGDGYAAELCVAPSSCIELIVGHVGAGLLFLEKQISGSYRLPTVYTVPDQAVAEAPPNVKRLGCAASYNVYGDPATPRHLADNIRTTGCHLHLSHPMLNPKRAEKAIMWCDILVGAVWTWLGLGEPELEILRRKAYGKAGEHRLNMYPNGEMGFEYRVLPGQVLMRPEYLSLMFYLARAAAIMAKTPPPEEWCSLARQAINNNDTQVADTLLQQVPFTGFQKQVLNFYKTKTLPYISTSEWWHMSSHSQGWRHTYYTQTLHRPTSTIPSNLHQSISKGG